MSLRDDVIALCRAPHAYTMVDGDARTPAEVRADAILALIRDHLGSDEAKVRAMSAAWKAYETEQGRPPEGADAMFMAVCAALLAAMEEPHDKG